MNKKNKVAKIGGGYHIKRLLRRYLPRPLLRGGGMISIAYHSPLLSGGDGGGLFLFGASFCVLPNSLLRKAKEIIRFLLLSTRFSLSLPFRGEDRRRLGKTQIKFGFSLALHYLCSQIVNRVLCQRYPYADMRCRSRQSGSWPPLQPQPRKEERKYTI